MLKTRETILCLLTMQAYRCMFYRSVFKIITSVVYMKLRCPFIFTYCSHVDRERFLSVWNVSTALSSRWSCHHYEGRLWANVLQQQMSSGWRRTSRKWSKAHGMFRGRIAAGQCQMFWKAKLWNTRSRSRNGKDESVLSIHGQIFGNRLSMH